MIQFTQGYRGWKKDINERLHDNLCHIWMWDLNLYNLSVKQEFQASIFFLIAWVNKAQRVSAESNVKSLSTVLDTPNTHR